MNAAHAGRQHSGIAGKVARRVRRKVERAVDQRRRYDYPAEGQGVIRQGSPVMDGLGSVFDPYVRHEVNGYRMYFSDRASGSVCTASSEDGILWSSSEVALSGSGDPGAWDCIVNRADVVRHSGRFYMWFTGQNERESSIGLATSDDGIHFVRAAGRPVIPGLEGCEAVMNPCVMWDEFRGAYRMWLAAGEKYEPDVLYHATSADGLSWTFSSAVPVLMRGTEPYDCAKVGGCDVLALPDSGGYLMFYIGYQNVDVGRICAAWSQDGIGGWKRFSGNPLLSPLRGSWESDSVYKPAVAINATTGDIHIWYNARSGTAEKIGAATIDHTAGLLNPENYR